MKTKVSELKVMHDRCPECDWLYAAWYLAHKIETLEKATKS